MDQPAWSDSEDEHRLSATTEDSIVCRFESNVSLVEEGDESMDDAPMIVNAESNIIYEQESEQENIIMPYHSEKDQKDQALEDDDDISSVGSVEQACQRYFLEKSGPKCFNCGQPGHMSRDCKAVSTLPCFLCGRVGHQRTSCPEELCHNCWRPGHKFRECKQPRKRRMNAGDICSRCGGPGHHSRECSLLWRRYVMRTSNFAEAVKKAKVSPVCYNCTSLDHFGDECPYERKRAEWTIFHRPDPEYLRMTAVGEGRSATEDSRRTRERSKDGHRDRPHDRDSRDVADRRSQQKSRDRDTRPSPNWQKMKEEVNESNYYKHFDGSYSGSSRPSTSGKRKHPEPRSNGGRDEPRHEAKRQSPPPSGKKSRPSYRGGYKPSSSK